MFHQDYLTLSLRVPAGMVGLVHAQAALAQAALLPILHLQDANPYVTGTTWAIPFVACLGWQCVLYCGSDF